MEGASHNVHIISLSPLKLFPTEIPMKPMTAYKSQSGIIVQPSKTSQLAVSKGHVFPFSPLHAHLWLHVPTLPPVPSLLLI